jgi:uncharacterized protein (DUF305 family)
MKDLTSANQKKSNFVINTMTIHQQIMEVMEALTASQQLRELEKLSKKIRKENSIRITKAVDVTRNKYPKK